MPCIVCKKETGRIFPPTGESICLSCQKEKYPLITKTRAKKEYLLTDSELNGLYCLETKNPYYGSAAPMKRYWTKEVEKRAIEKWGSLNNLKNRKQKRQVSRQKRFNKFSIVYKNPLEAIPDACFALFNLNRYAKHHTCSPKHKDEIYNLKHKFIKFLYLQGYAIECYEHSLKETTKECWRCEGTGHTYYDPYDDEYDEEYYYEDDCYEDESNIKNDTCHKCGGTGRYIIPDEYLHFICFRFFFNEKYYTWHIPKAQIDFEVTYTNNVQEWEHEKDVKPIQLKRNKFAGAKDLIRWILKHYSNETERIYA